MGTDPQQRSVEARLDALEKAWAHLDNPGSLTTREAVSLRDHFEARLVSIEKATQLAANTMDKRLDGMNEFRDTLRDQASRFVTRDEATLQIARAVDPVIAHVDAVCKQVDGLQTFQDKLEGKASLNAVYFSYGLGLLGLAVSVISLLMR